MPIKLTNTGPKSSTPSHGAESSLRAGGYCFIIESSFSCASFIRDRRLSGQMGLVYNELGQLKFSAELVQLGGNRDLPAFALINLANFRAHPEPLYHPFVFPQSLIANSAFVDWKATT